MGTGGGAQLRGSASASAMSLLQVEMSRSEDMTEAVVSSGRSGRLGKQGALLRR